MTEYPVWMSKEEISLIESYLTKNPNSTMLEFGCGGSTLHYSKFTRHYFSVEHNLEWAKNIKHAICERKLRDVMVRYITNVEHCYDYIRYPSYLNMSWDFVLIDGRFRTACAMSIWDYLRNDAVIFFHDFFVRDYYHFILDYYDIVDGIKSGQSLAVLKVKNGLR